MKPNRTAAIFFVWLCAWLNGTGWLLSALQKLNATGYAVSLVLFAISFGLWKKKSGAEIFSAVEAKKILRRFGRLPSGIFLPVALLAFIGGALYAPANFDALTYRLPRMLNWLAAGHWFWIPAENDRMNYSGVGWEWTAMPFFALLHSDRAMFLIDAASFLLMPGLLFSIFQRLGVTRKVAWQWMWLVPLAYGFVAQAGSIGNDLFGAVFILLAVDFGLRAKKSGAVFDVWCALLAAALLTGVKLSNLPLALPCVVAVWPAMRLLKKNLTASFCLVALAAVISALPIMWLNHKNTASWNGDPENRYRMQVKNPAAAFLGNSFLLGEMAFLPPVLPYSNQINDALVHRLPVWLDEQFPRLRGGRLNEIAGEEGAGISPIVTLPALLACLISLKRLRGKNNLQNFLRLWPPVVFAAWIAFMFYMCKMGSEAGPRLLLPYLSVPLTTFLLLPSQFALLRCRWWRGFLSLLALTALPVLIFSPNRPLFPAQEITGALASAHPQNWFLRRAADTYATYAHRNDFLAAMRAALPENVRQIGFIADSNDSDYSLWLPVGAHRVVYPRHDIGQFLKNPNIEWVVVKEKTWPEICPEPLQDWAAEHGAKIAATVTATELVSWGPENWHLLHIETPSTQ